MAIYSTHGLQQIALWPLISSPARPVAGPERDEEDGAGSESPPNVGLEVSHQGKSRLLRLLATIPLSRATRMMDLLILILLALITDTPIPEAAVVTIFVFLALNYQGGYRTPLTLSVLDQVPRVTLFSVLGGFVAFGVEHLRTATAPGPAEALAPLVMGGAAAISLVLARGLLYGIVHAMRSRFYVNYSTLIVGGDETGRLVLDILRLHPEHGLRPRAVWDLASQPEKQEEYGVPLLSSMPLAEAIRMTQADVLIVGASGDYCASQIVNVLRTSDRMSCDVYLVPPLHQMAVRAHDMEEIWGLPLITLRRPGYQASCWRLKRAFDIATATFMLVIAAPVLFAAAVAVRWEGGSGVLFRQERVGLDGHRFQLLKFRTMRPVSLEESATTWNVAADRRIGPVGRFLRQTSIDELPQLWNVIRGDMSLVGPRPERPYYVDRFAMQFPHYVHRHRVPSGVTGWAQIHGLRGDTSIHERAHFDNYYIENWSIWLDLKILMRTLLVVARREGA